MNKFIGTLLLQNVILIYLLAFIPIYLYLKPITSIAQYEAVLLFFYIILVIVISYLNSFLLIDKSLSFGFLRFIPFLILFLKFNSLLKKEFPTISLSSYQKYIIIIHLMNKHAILTEEEYTFFSKLIKPSTDDIEYEFSIFIETPFWVEVQEGVDHYSLQRKFLSEKRLRFSERSFAKKFMLFFLIYLVLVLAVFLRISPF